MTMIGMDVADVRQLSAAMGRGSGVLRRAEQQLGSALVRTRWLGSDAAAFRQQWVRHSAALSATADTLEHVGEQLRAEADDQERASDGGGATGRGGSDGDRRSDNRDPDGRDGRRVERDERRGGDAPGNGNFDNDWAGRAILDRYLTGGDDWVLDNDPTWTQYMQDNPSLTEQMAGYNDAQAAAAVQQYLRSGETNGTFDTTSSVALENGEGIVGYQYLHGTNADVGGFQHRGSTTVTPLPDGTYRVTVASHYRWNDVIDPNPQYSSDNLKSILAEIITLGRADPYTIHIGWEESSTVVVDAQGNVVSGSGRGWPY